MYKCPNCYKEYETYNGLSKHSWASHKLKGESLYRAYHNITDTPLCECGCGQEVSFRPDGYLKYLSGHNSKGETNPMYGKNHSDSAKKSISKVRKKKFASGELTINKKAIGRSMKKKWKTDDFRENMSAAREASGWRDKLSAAKSGENHPFFGKKRPEHSKLMKRPDMLRKIFAKRSDTDIERLVAAQLDEMEIEYTQQFFLHHDGQTYSFDFKLHDSNVLLEIDGDYWHGGPGCNKHFYLVEAVKENDALKDAIAKEYGYYVIRLWGSEVRDNILGIRSKLNDIYIKGGVVSEII